MILNKNNVIASAHKPLANLSVNRAKARLRRWITAISGVGLSGLSSYILALGLGDVQSQSYLGQPLSARVELVSIDGQVDTDNLIVRQVTGKEAQDMGVDYFYTPYQYQFEIVESDGLYYVKINSRQDIKEPFLSLLVELRWPTGVVYREYDILLDPPPVVTLADRMEEQAKEKASKPQASAPRPKPQSNAPKPAFKMELKPLETDEGQYKVQSGDTLLKIAERWSEGTDASLYQTSDWLFENNPNAFVRNDRNLIKAGATLSLPDLREFKMTDQPAAVNTEQDETVKISDTQASAQSLAELPKVDELRDEKTESKGLNDASASGDVKGLLTVSNVNRDDRTRELIDLLVRENDSLKSRIDKLESSEYVATMRELLLLQRQEIADLRAELGVEKDQAREEQVDDMLSKIGLDEKVVLSQQTEAAQTPNLEEAKPLDPKLQKDVRDEEALVKVNNENVVSMGQDAQDKTWLFWLVFAAGVALSAIFAGIFVFYRKLVPAKQEEEIKVEQANDEEDDLTPLKTVKFHAISDDDSFDELNHDVGELEDLNEDGRIEYDDIHITSSSELDDDEDQNWYGEKASLDEEDDAELAGAIREIQAEFSNLDLDEDSLREATGSEDEATLEALTEELPKEQSKEEKEKEKTRRPDEEVRLSIAEKMANYNPRDIREEFESLGVLEVDEDEIDIDEDNDLDAIIYRAMMYCEFKKFDKARELVQSKVNLFDDELLEKTMDKIDGLESNHQKRANG